MNGVAARAPVGWQRLTQKEHDEDKMSRMFVTTVSAIFVNRTHWSLSVRLFIRNFKLWQEPLIAGSVNFYKGKKKKVVRYKKKGLSFGTKMCLKAHAGPRLRAVSLLFENLWASAIYYAAKPRATRLCGRHHHSLLAAPPRASSTH